MADDRKIQIAGLNIVTQPHSPQNYIDLFRSLFGLKRPIAIRGTQHLMLGELRPAYREKPLNGLFGRFYRFDQIDPKAPWFNVDSNDVATKEEIAEIKIPPKLKPNLVMFNFVFYPRTHKLYFESMADSHTLGPASLRKFFLTICGHPTIVQKFGDVEITAIPELEQLERILKLPGLSKLVIDVKRPNPDDLADEEAEVFARFEKMGTQFHLGTSDTAQVQHRQSDVCRQAKRARALVQRSAPGQRAAPSASPTLERRVTNSALIVTAAIS